MRASRASDAHASEVLIRSIISLGSSLSLRVVSEGVEAAESLDKLRQLGCDIIQGYHIGRPVPGNDLVESMTGSRLTILETSPLGGEARKGAPSPPKAQTSSAPPSRSAA